MNFIVVSVSCNNISKLIEIKYFDNLAYQDIHYTISREFSLRDPLFHTSTGSAIKDSFLPDYIQNFAQDPNFTLYASEGNNQHKINPDPSPVIVNAFPIQRSQIPLTKPNAPILNYNPESNTPQNDFQSKEELLNFFKSNPICCIILATYQKTKKLSSSEQTKISKCIIQHLLFNHPNRTLAKYDLNRVINYILELFPGETREVYLKRSGKSINGKLYDAYNNYRTILAKQGIIVRRSRLQNDDKKHSENTDNITTMPTSSIVLSAQESFANQLNTNNLNLNLNSNDLDTNTPSVDNLLFANNFIIPDNVRNEFDIDSTENLIKFFKSNSIIRNIMQNYRKEKDITFPEKISLSKEIIKYILENTSQIISHDKLQKLSILITKVFPTEKSEYYYCQISPNGEIASGILYDMYKYMKTNPESKCKSQKPSTSVNLNEHHDLPSNHIKIENFETGNLSPYRYFNFDDMNNQSNEESELFKPVSSPISRKRKSSQHEFTDTNVVTKQTTSMQLNNSSTDNCNEIVQNFSDKLLEVHNNLLNKFFKNQTELIRKEQAFQMKRDEMYIKCFQDQTNLILDCLKSIIGTKTLTASSSVSTTSTTGDT